MSYPQQPVEVREATRADRGALCEMQVTSAEPPRDWRERRGLFEGRWELHAQSLVRGLRPPLAAGEHLLVAVDNVEEPGALVGALHYQVQGNQAHIALCVVALAFQRRGVATLLAQGALRDLNAVEGDITATVHQRNDASRALVVSLGFELVDCQAGWETYLLLNRHFRL